MSEPQPHSHKRPMDENEVPRNACTRARKSRRWHTQCNGIEMLYGLTLKWESLSPTHIRGRRIKMKCLETRAHGHANRGNGKCNAIWQKWYANMLMDFQQWNVGENSPEMRRKHTRCVESLPKCKIRHPKWPIAIPGMYNWYMEWKDRSKAASK